ncbi:MAG: BamA/TamA family outer membrane protein [Muribaculaceae bacterium]|nr:BamA/TamA family outer membrane protein [Muribaculaceae bacterium]
MTLRRTATALVLLAIATCGATAHTLNDSVSLEVVPLFDIEQSKPNFWKKVGGYLMGGGNDSTVNTSKTRFSIIGGPHYDSQAGLGLGVAGSAMFRLRGCDSLMQPSNVALTGDVSLKGFWSVSLRSNILFPDDKMRINLDAVLAYSPTYYWGMGYDMANDNANKTLMKKLDIVVNANVLWRLTRGLYVGPMVQWDFTHTDELDKPELLCGDDRTVRNYGVGLVVDYDTRDFITCASRGVYIHLAQLFRPSWLGNHYHYYTTNAKVAYYHKAWRDAIVAAEVMGVFNWGGYPSWAGMATMGDNYSMRGYYPGRFNDKHLLAAQLELRQHIWGPLGMVAWGGAGTVFHDSHSMGNILPNGGIGLRWAIRPRMNVRIDYGFGSKGNNGFIFTVNEAF